MAIEEAKYNVVKKDGRFEVRDYGPHILAETVVESDIEQAGSKAFRKLFRYISGDNSSRPFSVQSRCWGSCSAAPAWMGTAPIC